jgi:hypothetical protein
VYYRSAKGNAKNIPCALKLTHLPPLCIRRKYTRGTTFPCVIYFFPCVINIGQNQLFWYCYKAYGHILKISFQPFFQKQFLFFSAPSPFASPQQQLGPEQPNTVVIFKLQTKLVPPAAPPHLVPLSFCMQTSRPPCPLPLPEVPGRLVASPTRN